MLCLLVWLPLVLQVGAPFGVEHQFDGGQGSFLIWLFVILWVHRILVTFERWLTIIDPPPPPWPPMMFCIPQVQNKTRYYCSVCVWRKELSQGFYGVFSKSEFAHGGQSLAPYTFGTTKFSLCYVPMPLVQNNTRSHQDLYSHYDNNFNVAIAAMLHHKHVVGCSDQSRIKKKRDCWASLPPIMPHILPLYNCLVHHPNLLVHHNRNSS
jgi:hypothetical protein